MSAGLTDSSPTVDALDADNSPMLDLAATARKFAAANEERFNRTAINPGTDDFAVSGWVYFDTLSANGQIINCGAGSNGNNGFNVFARSSPLGQAGMYFNDSVQGSRLSGSCNSVFVVGQWQHWVVNFDRDGNMDLIVDGTSKCTVDISSHSASLDPASDLFLGMFAPSVEHLDGRLGRVIWHTKILDSDAITLLRNGGNGRLYGSFTDAEKTSLGIYAAWDGTEASGNLIDSHGSLDMTDNNTVTSASAMATGSRQFTAATSEYFNVSSNSNLQTGDTDFAFSMWVYPDTSTAAMTLVSKYTGSTATSEYYIELNTSLNVVVRLSAASEEVVTSSGSLSEDAWNHLVVEHDNGTGIRVTINGGSTETLALTGGNTEETVDFRVGVRTGSAVFLNGRLSRLGFWKKVLSAAELTQLYNDGDGLAYAALDDTLQTSLISYWNLDEASGNATDSHTNSYHLTDNNTVTAAGGITTATPFSVHVRAQCTTKPGSGVSEAVWEFGQTTGANNNVRIAFRNQGGTFLIRAVDADAGASASIDSSAISASTWYSILFVKRSASDRQLYVNTTSAGTDTSTSSSPSMQRLRLFASPAALATRSSDNVYLASMGIWDFDISTGRGASMAAPVSLFSNWKTVIDAGGVDSVASSLVDPGGLTTSTDHHYFYMTTGTAALVMMAYDDAATGVTADLVINVYGKDTGSTPKWCVLKDENGNQNITLTADATNDIDINDDSSGTDPIRIDALGSRTLLFLVKTAWNGSNGDNAVAYLLAKEL
jgi:hypothetical protein